MDQRYVPPAAAAVPPQQAVSADPVAAAFERAFAMAAFITNRHLVDHFMRTSRHFGLDYEAIVIWAVLAHQNCAHLMPPGSMPMAVLTEQGLLQDQYRNRLRPLRLRDLSQITGIPRETVRRKLLILRDKGWISEGDEGWLVVRDRVDELREFTEETVRRFLAAAGELQRVLGAATPPAR